MNNLTKDNVLIVILLHGEQSHVDAIKGKVLLLVKHKYVVSVLLYSNIYGCC